MKYPWALNSTLLVAIVAVSFSSTCYAGRRTTSGGSSTSTSSTFFKPAASLDAGYDETLVFPRGKVFPFSYYGLNTNVDLASFTMLGPGSSQLIPKAEQFGVQTIQVVSVTADEMNTFTDNQIREKIGAQVLAVADSPEIAWWYIKPEELRYWYPKEMNYLKVAAEVIWELDPYQRPVWNYVANHWAADALAKILPYQDICGKGMYVNGTGHQNARGWVRWSMEQEIKAIKLSNPGAIPIAMPDMYVEPAVELVPMIPAWVRHDVYLSLVVGAKGVVVYSAAHREAPGFYAYLDAYSQVAEELDGSLGQVFLFGERRSDLKLSFVSGPSSVSYALTGSAKASSPSVSMLNVAYRADRYLFLVNSASKPVTVSVDGFPSTPSISAYDAFSGQFVVKFTRKMQRTLAPLEVRAFVFMQ